MNENSENKRLLSRCFHNSVALYSFAVCVVFTSCGEFFEEEKPGEDASCGMIAGSFFSLSDQQHHNREREQSLAALDSLLGYLEDQEGHTLADDSIHFFRSLTLLKKGYRLQNYGMFTESMELYRQGIGEAGSIGHDSLLSHLYLEMAKLHLKIRNFGDWEKYAEMALEKAEKAGHSELVMEYYNTVRDPVKGMALAKELNHERYKGIFYYRLAFRNRKNGDLEAARQCLDSSIALLPSCDYLAHFQWALEAAELYSMTGDRSKQEENLEKGKSLAFLLNDIEADRELARSLHWYYSARGDTLMAMRNRIIADSLWQILHDSQTIVLLKELEHQVEVGNQEMEMVRLRNRISLVLVAVIFTFFLAFLLLYFLFRLRKINRVLQEANRFRDRLFSVISHDIRSPLISLINGLSLQKDPDPEQKNMKRRLFDLLALTDNLLNWSAAQIRSEKPVFREFELEELIERNIRLLEPVLAEKDMGIQVEPAGEWVVNSDEQMLDTCVRNLLTNAVIYNRAGGQVTIAVEQEKNRLKLIISDDGPGLQSADKPFREGIGLKNTRHFIGLLGGELKLEPNTPAGTVATLVLPVEGGNR